MEIVELQVLLLHIGGIRVEIIHGGTDHGAKPGINIGLRIGIVLEIHIKAGGDSAAQVFHDPDAGKLIDHFRRQLRFPRKHLLRQPFLQRKIVRQGTQKRHGGVGVSIFEGWHQQIPLQIDLPVKVRHIFPGRSHIADGISIHPDFPVLRHPETSCKLQDPSVIETNHVTLLLSVLP